MDAAPLVDVGVGQYLSEVPSVRDDGARRVDGDAGTVTILSLGA